MGLLLGALVEEAGGTDEIAREVALVELLAAREARHRGVVGEAEELDPRPGIGARRLVVGLDVGAHRPVELGEGRHHHQPAGTHDLDDLATPAEHLRVEEAHRVERPHRRQQRPVRPLAGLRLARRQAGAYHLGVVDQLRQHPLDVLVHVDLRGAHKGEAERHHELGLGEVLGDKLVRHPRARPGPRVDGVERLHVTVEEDPLPGHLDIVEHDHAVGLVEPARQREIERGAGLAVDHGGAANQPHAGRRHRHREADREGLCLLGIRQRVGRRGHHHQLVGKGAQRRQHPRAPDHDAGIGLAHRLGRQIHRALLLGHVL